MLAAAKEVLLAESLPVNVPASLIRWQFWKARSGLSVSVRALNGSLFTLAWAVSLWLQPFKANSPVAVDTPFWATKPLPNTERTLIYFSTSAPRENASILKMLCRHSFLLTDFWGEISRAHLSIAAVLCKLFNLRSKYPPGVVLRAQAQLWTAHGFLGD